MLSTALKTLREWHQQGVSVGDVQNSEKFTATIAEKLVAKLPLQKESEEARALKRLAEATLREKTSNQYIAYESCSWSRVLTHF